jgi:hypothetical protein
MDLVSTSAAGTGLGKAFNFFAQHGLLIAGSVALGAMAGIDPLSTAHTVMESVITPVFG